MASELYLTFEDRGHRVSLATDGALNRRPAVDHRELPPKQEAYRDDRERWAPGQPTVVGIGPLAVGLTIYELSERIEVRYVKGEWVPVTESKPERWRSPSYDRDWTTHKDRPSGRCVVRAYSPYGFAEWSQEWRDDKPGQLSKRVKRICTEVQEAAPRLSQMVEEGRQRAEEQHRKWLVEQEEAKRRREEERRGQARKQSRESLLTVIARWGDVVRVQGFFADAEHRVATLWERSVANELRRRIGTPTVQLEDQVGGRYLAKAIESGLPAVGLRPDIVISQNGRIAVVADTKWKRVQVTDSRYLLPSSDDLLQMYAYATAFRCERLLLIYPAHHGVQMAQETTFELPKIDSFLPTVSVMCVDVEGARFDPVLGASTLRDLGFSVERAVAA